MHKSEPATRRRPRAGRLRPAPRVPGAPTTSSEELSAYELLERRSRELEIERAQGGFGTPQPPDAETPLLFPRFAADRPAQKIPKTSAKRRPQR